VNLTALAAIFGSAILHAAWNALLKNTRDPAAASIVIVFGAVGLTVVLALVVGPAHITSAGCPWIVATGLVEGLYFVMLSVALSSLPLGTAYGVSRGAGLLLVWPLSIAFFHERVDAPSLAGAVLLGAGLLAQIQGAASVRGVAAALVCAIAIALYPLGYKRALQEGVDPYPLFAMSLGVALPVQLALLRTERLARVGSSWRDQPRRLLLGACLCAGSFILFLVALDKHGPGRVTALRNSSILFATLFGWWSGEPRTVRSISSAALVAAGAVLLSWR
jgi:drug/metabolite transporter (DMT)-like permease